MSQSPTEPRVRARCPKHPEHTRFITVATELHDWLVDERGNFLEDRGCLETVHRPDIGNTWSCAECGADAETF